MTYTVRYAHLAKKPELKVGDKVYEGDKIGVMGNTGASHGAHLHLDNVVGRVARKYTLEEIERGNPTSDIRQLNMFIDDGLFKALLRITTYYGCPDYQRKYKKVHTGYDVVPESGDWSIYWNRSKAGEVIAVVADDPGYGNYIQISYVA